MDDAADYIIEVRQELFRAWQTNAETPSFPATDNAILYRFHAGDSVDQCVDYFLDLRVK